MKFKFLFVLFFFGCSLGIASSAQAASLIVSSPVSGQLWTAGSTQNITWAVGSLPSPVYANQQPVKVFITLNPVSLCASSSSCGAGALVPYVIAENIPDTGSYEWSVPATLPEIYPGPVTVEVGLADSSAEGTSGQFNIIPSNPYLSSSPLISPNGGESWAIGSTKTISWTTTATSTASTVNLLLVPAICGSGSCGSSGTSTTNTYTIASNIPNTGSYSWNINTNAAGNIISPGQYLVSVVNPDGNSVIGSSAGLFNLTASSNLLTPGSADSSNITTPVISQLSANSGSVGIILTISGSGFTQSGNTVQFGPNTDINNLSSSDGMTLQFAVPAQTQGCGPSADSSCNSSPSLITPGAYGVSVINSNGNSNSLPFNLIATSSTVGVPVNPPPPLSNFSQGELVMFGGNPTVYLVQNGWLVPFNSAQVFMARGYNWVSVQTVPSVLFNSQDVAPYPVTVPDGSLIKSPDNPTVYLVVGGQKSGIPSMSVLDSLGLNLNKLIILSDKEIAGYPNASNQS